MIQTKKSKEQHGVKEFQPTFTDGILQRHKVRIDLLGELIQRLVDISIDERVNVLPIATTVYSHLRRHSTGGAVNMIPAQVNSGVALC